MAKIPAVSENFEAQAGQEIPDSHRLSLFNYKRTRKLVERRRRKSSHDIRVEIDVPWKLAYLCLFYS